MTKRYDLIPLIVVGVIVALALAWEIRDWWRWWRRRK